MVHNLIDCGTMLCSLKGKILQTLKNLINWISMLVSHWVIILWLLFNYIAEDTFADSLISSRDLKEPTASQE